MGAAIKLHRIAVTCYMGLLMHEMGRESGENALQDLSYMLHPCVKQAT